MGMLRKLTRGGAAAGLLNMAMREARKPQNQRKAKDLFAKAQARRGGGRPTRPVT